MTKNKTAGSIVRERFSISARQVLVLAQAEADRYQQSHLNPAHLLLGLAQAQGEARGVLIEAGLSIGHLRTVIESFAANGEPSLDPPVNITPETKQVMKTAVEEAQKHHHRVIRSGHLLLGILALDDKTLLEALEINPDHLREQVEQAFQVPPVEVASEEEPEPKRPWWKFWR